MKLGFLELTAGCSHSSRKLTLLCKRSMSPRELSVRLTRSIQGAIPAANAHQFTFLMGEGAPSKYSTFFNLLTKLFLVIIIFFVPVVDATDWCVSPIDNNHTRLTVDKRAFTDQNVSFLKCRLFCQGFLVATLMGNDDFFLNGIAWLLEEESQLGERPTGTIETLVLPATTFNALGLASVAGIPGGALLIGLVVWARRRRL